MGWCTVSREQVLDCIAGKKEMFDTDGDDALDLEELKTLFHETIPKTYHPFLKSLGGVEATMKHCDVDEDGKISNEDFKHSEDTCLASCWKRIGASHIFC